MKICITLIFILCFISNNAQQTQVRTFTSSQMALVADSGKHVRHYNNGYALKIHYLQNGRVTKAKGRLLVNDSNHQEIELVLFGGKSIISINIDSIKSIGQWKRGNKIVIAVLAGIGVAAYAFAETSAQKNVTGNRDNLLEFMLTLYAAVDLYYIGIATPVTLLTDWLSIRSQKKGYYFFVT